MINFAACFMVGKCCNPSLGLVTKARACKGAGQEGGSAITFHAFGSASECEGMKPHSQVSSHFGSWSPSGLPNFQKIITRVKTHCIKEFIISMERSWNLDVKMGLHDPFGHLTHKI